MPLLAQAPTLRNAAILLDQHHGAFKAALAAVQADLDSNDRLAAFGRLERLRELAPVGAHLVTPWEVVLAGPPNAGKSSLMNALAGYQRSVVTAVPGTTRDAVRVELALDGVAVRLTDTAGLRDTADSLEAEGVRRAEALMASADLVLRLIDGADPVAPPASHAARTLVIWNKADLAYPPPNFPHAVQVSAATGQGLRELISRVVATLEPVQPSTGRGGALRPAPCGVRPGDPGRVTGRVNRHDRPAARQPDAAVV